MGVLPGEPPGRIADLGAGWGTLAFALAKKYPNTSVVAYENSLIPYLYLKTIKLVFQTKNIEIVRKDFYKENLSPYDLIVCYLYPGAMERLSGKFNTEFTEQTSVYSNTFAIPNVEPQTKWTVHDIHLTTLYHYRYPLTN